MKLFGVVLLAGLVSLAAGLAVAVAGAALPCYSDKAGCGLGDAYRILLVPLYAVIGMIGLGISAPGQARERPLKLAMLTLILASIFLGLFGAISDLSKGRSSMGQSLIEVFQIFSPFWAVVAMQYFMIRNYLRRRDKPSRAAT